MSARVSYNKPLGSQGSGPNSNQIEGFNLTEEVRRTNFQFSNAVFNQFDSGRTIMVGLRGSF